jgi:hypothetical protein
MCLRSGRRPRPFESWQSKAALYTGRDCASNRFVIAKFLWNTRRNTGAGEGASMQTRLSAATIGVILLAGSGALAACPPGQTRNCVNFDLVPEISQQIVSEEPTAASPKAGARAKDDKPYTGPTVGIAPGVRRAPTVGYRWALQ